jgi:hypothetical protein
MTAETLSLLAGVVLSLLFSYVPGLNVKFAALGTEVKRLIMLGLLVSTATGVYGLSCSEFGPIFGILLVCDSTGLVELVRLIILAAITNQTAYALTPLPAKVKSVRTYG